eukprot:TRINITY_DN1251_c0_g2_i1.p1 TRINITY_DN1251_c0_g2~~TRINITY_DN1251_c0_g2_i1.p1  ORF type:complete len:198 (-),score=31.78 TRINITY_DN1251_c0_g2_i1:21-557(-)
MHAWSRSPGSFSLRLLVLALVILVSLPSCSSIKNSKKVMNQLQAARPRVSSSWQQLPSESFQVSHVKVFVTRISDSVQSSLSFRLQMTSPSDLNKLSVQLTLSSPQLSCFDAEGLPVTDEEGRITRVIDRPIQNGEVLEFGFNCPSEISSNVPVVKATVSSFKDSVLARKSFKFVLKK